ncbi:MAG: hypothetical protein AB7C91_01125 [Sphaerochaeta sp.]|jgi:hypothetical protein|uniref:hypothetical protein n=1 Tax=Sphaerochaeta sp. TaxID=1972642 RepID=UPI003D0C8907
MDELHTIFTDFKTQVEEISEHAEQVHSLVFRAELKNGTSFNFSYNAEKFAKESGPRLPYHPVSIFNGVFDIVSSAIGIALLVILAMHRSSQQYLAVLTFSAFITTFICSALYHFFSMEQRSSQVFATLKEIGKILSILLVNLTYATLLFPSSLVLVRSISLVLVALSLLFLTGRTKLSLQVSLLVSLLLPWVSFVSLFSLETLLRCLLFSLWSLTALMSGKESRLHSNSVFALMGLVSFFLELAPLLMI